MTGDYKRAGDLIDRIEMKIDSGLATPEYLEDIQRQLRDLPVPQKDQDHRYSQYINESRALTYQAFGKDSDALKYIHAALNEAGSVKKLHSSMLQKYVLKNHLVVSEHKTSSASQTKPTKLDMLSENEQSFMNNEGLGQGQDVDLLFRSPKQFAIMYILSGGRYEWYWVYKNWQAIQIASGRKTSPFWRTFFNIFYIWPLLNL